jgi:hypothetical protein
MSRLLLKRALAWEDAHVSFETAVEGLTADQAGVRPPGLPHSVWELVEHIRLAQRDILDFCVAATYTHGAWPDDYWPPTPQPPSPEAWQASLDAVRSDRDRLAALASDPAVDLSACVPHATSVEQTFARELLVAADHAAYHVGQIVLVRRLLGRWPASR